MRVTKLHVGTSDPREYIGVQWTITALGQNNESHTPYVLEPGQSIRITYNEDGKSWMVEYEDASS